MESWVNALLPNTTEPLSSVMDEMAGEGKKRGTDFMAVQCTPTSHLQSLPPPPSHGAGLDRRDVEISAGLLLFLAEIQHVISYGHCLEDVASGQGVKNRHTEHFECMARDLEKGLLDLQCQEATLTTTALKDAAPCILLPVVEVHWTPLPSS